MFSGFFEYTVWPTGLTSLGGSRLGKQIFNFKDGGLLSVKDGTIEITGLGSGPKVHNFYGVSVIKDHINMLEAEITYNPKNGKGVLSSIKGKLWGSSKNPLTDLVDVQISIVSPGGISGKEVKKVVCSGGGSWLSHLEFDGKLFWKIDDPYESWSHPSQINPEAFLCPSDSTFRQDL